MTRDEIMEMFEECGCVALADGRGISDYGNCYTLYTSPYYGGEEIKKLSEDEVVAMIEEIGTVEIEL